MRSSNDMTTGSPWQKILIFTLPMLLGNIAQQLYNTVDSIVVGQYIGDNALAAARVAARAGISGAERYVDATTLETEEEIGRAHV